MSINWDVIEQFVGYGPEDAQVVFIGMEEGTGRHLDDFPDELAKRSQRRSFEEIDGSKGMTVRTWRVMCDFMLRRKQANLINRDTRLDYQRHSLGRLNGESLVAELMPYPSPATNVWPYANLGRDPDRKAYVARLRTQRLQLLRRVLAAHPREFIICYGKAYSSIYKELFPAETPWQRRNDFELAIWNGARIALTAHFSGRSFNSDEQMAALYRELAAL